MVMVVSERRRSVDGGGGKAGRKAAGTVDSVEAGGGHPGVGGRGPISMAHLSSPPKLITLGLIKISNNITISLSLATQINPN